MPAKILVDPNDKNHFRDQLKTVKEILDQGGTIAFPTDTFYGLGANPFNESAIARIFEIKERAGDKPLLVLISSLNQLEAVASSISSDAGKLMDHFWPGRLTLLLHAKNDLPDSLTASTGKIGVRLPANKTTRALIEETGTPLTAPSANISGGKNPQTAKEVEETLGDKVDLIIDGGHTPGGKVSTLLDTTVSPPAILRQGAVSTQEIESVLKKKCSSTI